MRIILAISVRGVSLGPHRAGEPRTSALTLPLWCPSGWVTWAWQWRFDDSGSRERAAQNFAYINRDSYCRLDYVAPRWTDSTTKRGVARGDAIYVLLNATYTDVLADQSADGGQVRLFIGPRHAQALSSDEIEILVHEFPTQPGREAVIFHVQPLGAKFRRYREEHPRHE